MDKDIESLFKLRGEEFEKKRREILEAEFNRIGEIDIELAARARAQQWALEQRLDKIKNPLVRFEKMQEMFWKKTLEMRNALMGLSKELK